MNAGIGAGSYGLGGSLDPESAKIVRKYVSNLAGPHSLMATAGFTAGQAARAGQDPLSGKTLQEFADALPLPTNRPIMDWLKAIRGGLRGELTDPTTGKSNVPPGMIPFKNWDFTAGFPSMGAAPTVAPRYTFRKLPPT